MALSVADSQNFSLRISDSFNVSDSQQDVGAKESIKNNNDSIILISDSDIDSSLNYNDKKEVESIVYTNKKPDDKNHIRHEICISETSESENSDLDNNHVPTFTILQNNTKNNIKPVVHCRQSILTSDSSPDINFKTQKSADGLKLPGNTHISPTPQIHFYASEKSVGSRYMNNHKDHLDYISSSSSNSSNDSCSKSKSRPIFQNGSSKKPMSLKNTLTKQDAKDIFRNIRSTKLIYESPLRKTESNVIINDSIDDEKHPAIDNHKYLKMKTNGNVQIVNETDSIVNSDDEDIQGPQTILGTCKDNMLTTANENVDPGLSERKRDEICQWIMNNSPESKSDSSLSHVPPSNKSKISSGESSLERLEMEYETPNNRGKVLKLYSNEKTLTKSKTNEGTHNSILRQATMHRFLQNSSQKLPDKSVDRGPQEQLTPTVQQTPQDMNILHCANILDKLYGDTWRKKADVLLPSSEPRKHNIVTKDRAVQTEKKKTCRRFVSSSDSEEDDFNIFAKNIKPGLNSTRKPVKEKRAVRDSFIDDESLSDSGSDSIYHTALTNPRKSETAKPKPISAITRKIIQICDTDTEDEDTRVYPDHDKNLGRRKLSFSDDDDDDGKGSSTSEFDPGDEVPPKPSTVKKKQNEKGGLKKPCDTYKKNVRCTSTTLQYQRIEKNKSFLASLSENVPLKEAHPDAKIYRTDFKNSKEELCRRLFKMYNEKIFDNKLPADMSIEWNVRMRGSAGFCYNKRSIKTLSGTTKSSRIVLATKILDTPDRLRDTLVHEMCHAAAWLINDVSDGHGPYWKGWASKAMKTFPELPPIKRCHDYQIKTKFTYKCTGCGYSIGRHSKSLDTERKRCGHCYGKFELLINKTTKSGTVQMQTPKRELTGFARFVKENYTSVKKDRNIKHAEVMKILGQQFSAIKIAKKQNDAIENNTDCSP